MPFVFFGVSLLLFSLSSLAADQANPRVVETGPSDKLILPPPNATRAVANPASVIPWPKGKTPTAPAGFEVSLFADELDNPRMIYVLPNGDVLVMESLAAAINEPNRIAARQRQKRHTRPCASRFCAD